VFGIVVKGGNINVGDAIDVKLPEEPYIRLAKV